MFKRDRIWIWATFIVCAVSELVSYITGNDAFFWWTILIVLGGCLLAIVVCLIIWPPPAAKIAPTEAAADAQEESPYPWYVAQAARHVLVLASNAHDARIRGEAQLGGAADMVRPASGQEIEAQSRPPKNTDGGQGQTNVQPE